MTSCYALGCCKKCRVYDPRLVHKFRILWTKNCPFFSLRHTRHVQMNHAVTSAVKRIPVLMGEHAQSCATTPKKSSTAHAPMDFSESSAKKVLYLASSYNSIQRRQNVLLYTHCMILQASLSTKRSVISLLKMDSFGLCSKPSAWQTTTSRLSHSTKITQWTRTLSSGTSFASHCG